MSTQLRMLVQNTVQDYPTWRQVFDENLSMLPPFGLALEWVRVDTDDPTQVWFSLLVEDRARADEFLSDPANIDIGKRAGVTGGQIHYISDPVPTPES
ncbi:MAG: hypothetical protein JJ974_11035 [Phycisphaerales bacterium]|nr:hypothetical protein [Phycisphaerales bacterium]